MLEPEEVPGVRGAVQIAVGSAHSCARLADGSVRCWGSNTYGQRGRSNAGPQPSPVEGISTAVDLVSGEAHLCARLEDRSIRCWGAGSSGQLGDDGDHHQTAPVASSLGQRRGDLYAAGAATCVFDRELPALFCVGESTTLKLGLDDPIRGGLLAAEAVGLGIGSASHACAVLRDGGVACWGDRLLRAARQRTERSGPDVPFPETVANLSDVVAIGAGDSHTCAVRRDGRAFCWGPRLVGSARHRRSSGRPGAYCRPGYPVSRRSRATCPPDLTQTPSPEWPEDGSTPELGPQHRTESPN